VEARRPKGSGSSAMHVTDSYVGDFTTSKGDVLRVSLTEDNSVISQEVREVIDDIHILGIELLRIEGTCTIGLDVFRGIESFISEVFQGKENAVILYYCDFLNPIPKTSKNSLPCQEYRSRLFENMFKRFTQQRRISNVRLSVITVSGIDEKYYFHVIYRDVHAKYAAITGSDIKEGLGK